MTDSVTIKLPDTFQSRRNKKVSSKNQYSGQIALPARWTGGDYEEYIVAGKGREDDEKDNSAPHPWLAQWLWAKKRIVSWDIDGLPTNPNQINDDDLPFMLMSWITQSVYESMRDYMEKGAEEIKEMLAYPEPEALSVNEFFAWEEVTRSLKENGSSEMMKSFDTFRVLIRAWPDGKDPPKDAKEADLALIAAVNEIGGEIIGPALDLGNWPVLLGDRSTITE